MRYQCHKQVNKVTVGVTAKQKQKKKLMTSLQQLANDILLT
jgi:hypothetical protein